MWVSALVSGSGGGRLLGGQKGLGCGGRGGQGRASGSGALEVLAEGQDAEHKISYSRETSLITAGGYSEGILWPAWDARGKKKKKSCLFAPRVHAISGTPEIACFASSTNPTSQEGKYKSIFHLPILHVQFYYQ